MISSIKRLAASTLIRNIAVVATGTATAQAIVMIVTPIITRLYGPENYGILGIFGSVVGVLSTVAALGYPRAIVLAKSETDARGIAKLSLYIGVAMTALTAISLMIFGDGLLRLLNAEAIANFIYLIPVAIFFSVVASVLAYWLNREKAFRLAAKYQVFTALVVALAKSGMGFVQPTAVTLIATNVIGIILGAVITFRGWLKLAGKRPGRVPTKVGIKTLKKLAIRHRDFPLLRSPQDMINALSRYLPLLLLGAYFGPAAAGQYGIAFAALGVPAVLIGGAVMSVFYPRITEAIHKGENARAIIIKGTVGMALVGALPYLVVIVTGPQLFSYVFGAEWYVAGVYAQWLSPWLFLQYLNKPALAAIPALRLQGALLVYELFSTGTKIIALWLGFAFFGNAVIAIALFSMSGVIAYLWLILWVIRKSRSSIRYRAMDAT